MRKTFTRTYIKQILEKNCIWLIINCQEEQDGTKIWMLLGFLDLWNYFNQTKNFKGATKFFFFFFNTGFPKLAYSTYSFEELVLVVCLCFPCFLLVLCFEFNATICKMVIYISATCSTIFSNITTCKNIKNLLWNVDCHLQ